MILKMIEFLEKRRLQLLNRRILYDFSYFSEYGLVDFSVAHVLDFC